MVEQAIDTRFPLGVAFAICVAVGLENLLGLGSLRVMTCTLSIQHRGMGRDGDAYKVVQIGGTVEVDACVVTPLQRRDHRAILHIGRAIKDIEVIINQPNALLPIPDSLRPRRIRRITRIPCQPGTKIEETPVRNAVFICEPIVELENLPSQPTATRRLIPAGSHLVEDCLGEGEPLWLVGIWVVEVGLGGEHGSHSPKALIVITFVFGLVDGHVVGVGADLELQGLGDDIVVRGVAGAGPVVYHGHHHAATFPPKEWVGQDARCTAGKVSFVERHHVESYGGSGGFYGSFSY